MNTIDESKVKYYPLGTIFMHNKRECTVIDILRTYNINNELVSIRYVSAHNMLGQLVKNNDIVATTIARNFITIGETKPNFTNSWFSNAFD